MPAARLKALHSAIDAARDGDWDALDALIFAGERESGAAGLTDDELNTVPAPRRFGVLHQLCYWGHVGVLERLVKLGVRFDAGVRSGGATAAERCSALQVCAQTILANRILSSTKKLQRSRRSSGHPGGRGRGRRALGLQACGSRVFDL